MSKDTAEVQLNIHALLDTLGDVCDEADLPRSQEMAAVSMLMAVVAYKWNMSKEDVLEGMANVIDEMYASLNQEDEEQPCDQG